MRGPGSRPPVRGQRRRLSRRVPYPQPGPRSLLFIVLLRHSFVVFYSESPCKDNSLTNALHLFDCSVLSLIVFFNQTKVNIDARALIILGTKYRAFNVEAHYSFLRLMLHSCSWLFLSFCVLARFTVLGDRNKQIRRQNFSCWLCFVLHCCLTFGHKSVGYG